MAAAPMTVVETERFLRDARPLLPDEERAELVAFVGANPQAGRSNPRNRRREEVAGGRCPEGASAVARG